MSHKRAYSILISLVLFAFMLLPHAFAKVSLVPTNAPGVEPSSDLFVGTLVHTGPDGQIKIYETGDAVPEIVSGSTLEVFDGHLTVATQEGDSVILSLLGNEFKLENEAEVTVICGVNDCTMIVHKGIVTYSDESGQVGTLEAPRELQVFLGQPLIANPTAAGEAIGFNPEADYVPDSRNIQSSPSS